MKKLLFPLSYLFIFLVVLSCTGDEVPTKSETPVEPEIPEVAVDNFKYLVLRNDGQLFEIGDATGKVTRAGKLQNIDFNILFNAIATSPDKIYIYEHEFDPFQGYIHIMDRESRTTEVKKIDIPQEYGESAGIISLDWDETNQVLVAIIKANLEANIPPTSRVVTIDPGSMEITSLDIELDRNFIATTSLLRNKLYVSTLRSTSGENSFFKIDLVNRSRRDITVDNGGLPPVQFAHRATANELFAFLPVQGSNFMGEFTPVILDLDNNEVDYLLPSERMSTRNYNTKSIYNSEGKEYVSIVASSTYIGLFRYNVSDAETKITHISNFEELSSLCAIIDVKKI